ncbi:MAG TPA: histone deacetylase [Firmicutes bacterium]|jgi:acetoin utilization deacetylase AcuC-like enzyme|nr:histone deacetylase [Bacillota bacterium]
MDGKPKVGLVFFPAFDWAIAPDHPEREERLLYTRDQIREEGLLDLPEIEEFRPQLAAVEDIERVHICVPSVAKVCTESHLIAAGGTVRAGQLVTAGKTERAFALLRPPGHHALRIVHGSRGFCTINSEAVLVEYLRKSWGGRLRVAIVDTDAHHADGTQDVYYNDPDILHISIHQDGRTLYPGTGAINELGGPGAYGLTLNLPLPPGSGDPELLYAVEHLVLPVLKDFQPDLVINAAGQDNHFTDPLTNMNVTAQGYARLTELLAPDLVVLEGGYSIEGSLPYVNVGIILALAGLDYTGVLEPELPPELRQERPVREEVVHNVAFLQETWASRKEADLERVFGADEFFRRKRRLYYDTDDIHEMQLEEIKRCGQCSGYRKILSFAERYGRKPVQIAAVLLPWHACATCRHQAQEVYAILVSSTEWDYVYLQNPEDQERPLVTVSNGA